MTTDTDYKDALPADWDSWPRSEKVEWLSVTHTRKGLLQRITRRAGIDRDLTNSSRLTVQELSAVALELGEVDP